MSMVPWNGPWPKTWGRATSPTTLTVPENLGAHGIFLAKQDFSAAGLELLPLIYQLGGGADVKLLTRSGDSISKGMHLAEVRGSARVLLSCERVALNFLQRLSGVATLAHQHVRKLGSSKTRVLDTRKTTPGLRILEKMAVAAGGAMNHRNGLYDAVLIKNNHITAAGGVTKALDAVRVIQRAH